MRAIFTIGLCALSISCFADHLIRIPVGRKIPYLEARLEHLFDQTEPRRNRTRLDFGLTEAIEASLVVEDGWGRGRVESFDVSYNVLPPLTNIAPGLSVGVTDGIGKTRDGRSFYVAATYRIGLTGRYNGDVPLEVSHGYAVGDHDGYFVGVTIPFRESFRLLAEHDGRRVNAALEFRPLKDVWVRWIHRPEQSLWSITLVKRR